MDVNGLPVEGFQSINLPAGLGAVPPLSSALGTPDAAPGVWNRRETDNITESEMEHLILEYKDAGSAKDAEKVLEEKVPKGQMGRVLDGLEEDFFS